MDDVIMPRRKEIVGDKKYVSISLHADLMRKVDDVIDKGGRATTPERKWSKTH